MNLQDEDLQRVDKALNDLGEFFDSVQIFCTRKESSAGGTVSINKGCGDYFARYGKVKEWLVKEEEVFREEVRKGED